jgi:hypothetical protein
MGGDLLGDTEVIACEVKDKEPFLKSAGQALGYSVMAHRCYLATDEEFTRHQRDIAAHLGIGLISIRGGKRPKCTEIQSAPRKEPVALMAAELIEQLGYAACCLCQSYFRVSDKKSAKMTSSLVLREGNKGLWDAYEDEKGFVYWIEYLRSRRKDSRSKNLRAGWLRDRRYVCGDCVLVLGDAIEEG